MPKTKSSLPPTPTEKKWVAILKRFRSSGMGPKSFCRKEKLKTSQFWHWRRQIRLRQEARKNARKAAPKQSFLPVKVIQDIPAMDSPVEVVLRSGRLVRLSGKVDGDLLRTIVSILEETA
jgi:hypothetical protein